MNPLEGLNFEQPKLFVFYLGGKINGYNIEMHDVAFIVGKNSGDIVIQIKQKWPEFSGLHIDSYMMLENVDGYDLSLSTNKIESTEKLYFVNLGSYTNSKFGENHWMGFYVAKSRAEAIERAKTTVLQNEELVHGDNVYNLDDCIRLDKLDDIYINLHFSGKTVDLVATNGYMKLK